MHKSYSQSDLSVDRETINEAIQGKSGDYPLCDVVPVRRQIAIGGAIMNRQALMSSLGMDFSQIELRMMAQLPPLDMCITNRGMPKGKSRMTKNRRIRRKWAKRYGLPKKTVYRNCQMVATHSSFNTSESMTLKFWDEVVQDEPTEAEG